MAKSIRVAIVGGQWGITADLKALRALPDYEVVAICTAHRETAEPLAREHAIPMAFWDWREVVRHPDIDLVDACVRPRVRTEIMLEAMRHGKHVRSEVPFARNAAEARALRDEAAACGVCTLIGYEWQLMPAFRIMAEKVQQGFLGEPYFGHAQLQFAMYGTPENHREYLWQGIAEEGASGLHNLAGSALGILRQCFGSEVVEVAGMGETFRKEWRFPDGSTLTPDAIDSGLLIARFANGFTATVQGSWVAGNANNWFLDLYGSEGRLVVETPPNDGFNCNLILSGGKRGQPTSQIPAAWSDRFRRDCTLVPKDIVPQVICGIAEGFIRLADAIRDGSQAYPNFEDGFRLVSICDAAIESYKTRQWIRLDT
jgi:predicted dehydrogenase